MAYMFAARCRGEPVSSSPGNYCVVFARDITGTSESFCTKEAAIPTGVETGYATSNDNLTQYTHYIKFTHTCHEHGDGERISGIAFVDHSERKLINNHICGDKNFEPSIGYNFGIIELSQLNYRQPAS
ncbi:unnamed protein product [Bursaphelenchus okinawaensis]|uniref:Uncharacterized protein n=1 Tax=Bursaphelenchus okinawaensis TaxID=465554 RepID=A0A811LEU1_9BILA|nr:unnamed protein product [Bursaphelenchus okinawaensis]CAG9121726.1 unnamed protein product [Bursaphelenchus okinawaensis]